MSSQAWLVVWLLLILKLPIAYLGWVVWWAIKATPETPPPGASQLVVAPAPSPCRWSGGRRSAPCSPRRRAPLSPPAHRATASRAVGSVR